MVTTTQLQTELKQRISGKTTGPQSPYSVTNFPDIKTIRDAIPAHCFQASTVRSLSYVVRDYTLAAALGYVALCYIPSIESSFLRSLTWLAYTYVQGLVCTGIWILAHECGHSAFSPHKRLNDFVGWFCHSSLIVPYFSWKFSHHRHHNYTGHMERDTVFVPRTRDEFYQKRVTNLWLDPDLVEDLPIVQLIKLVLHQVAGWQAYTFLNATAGKKSTQTSRDGWFRASHFEPTSAVFRSNEALGVALSDLGIGLVFLAMWVGSKHVGWQTVILLWIVPYFWVHHWLVAITYLHHTHPEVHHYDADHWTFVKGALATIDRDFGFVGRHLFHGIIECHVVHHLFPRIPFYKAEEATEAIRPLLGELYHRQDTSFVADLWKTFITCKYVESDPDAPGAMRWGKAEN